MSSNDSSISLRVEFPARRYLLGAAETPAHVHEEGAPVAKRKARSLVLGGDAQTVSWSFVLTDFPYLRKSDTPAAKAIAAATGDVDLLSADVLKVSHHGSKHGVNLELVERIDPRITLVSSVPSGGNHNFPHAVAQDLIREALDPSTTDGHPHAPDHEMGIFYTCDSDDVGQALGTAAVIVDLQKISLWRFGEGPMDPVDLGGARLLEIAPD